MIDLKDLKQKLSLDLPGDKAHLEMTPYRRVWANYPPNKKEGATLLVLYKKESKWHFPLIKRNSYPGVHSDQVSFPGGKKDPEDHSFWDTALRETSEEIGLSSIEQLGALSSIYIPPSNFMVYPFVGVCSNAQFKLDPREVAYLIEVPLTDLFSAPIVSTQVTVGKGLKLKTPCFIFEKEVVWGATAAVLNEFKQLFV